MSFTIISNGKTSVRHLDGNRTLVEILTEEEVQAIQNGKLVAVSALGILMCLSSKVNPITSITLKEPDEEIRSMFKFL